MDLSSRKIFVLGAARSGTSAALLAKRMGAYVFVSDKKRESELEDTLKILKENGIDYETGKNSFERIKGFDILILSPGVHLSESQKAEIRACGVRIISELEFASNFIRIPIIAITGTNGKSTTTALTGYILQKAGFRVFVGGNIGNAISNMLIDGGIYDIAVIEVSSFMLEDILNFRPHITVITNISPDHLDKYDTYEEYVEAKLNIFRNLTEDSEVVLNLDCEDLITYTKRFKVKKIFFSRNRTDVDLFATKIDGGWKIVSNIEEKNYSLFYNNHRLVGVHNVENVLSASSAAILTGVEPSVLELSINTFEGLEHRIEFVREINGVRFYNDSKATNIDSTIVALNSFEKGIVWIAGGRHKGRPYTVLKDIIKDRVKRIIAIGEAAPLIQQDLRDVVEVENYGIDFEGAIKRAYEIADHKDIVLLSPACSSYDMFKDYEERGRRFKEIVYNLEARV